jgi:thioredoxin-like negative regulator of GroEL
VSVDAEQIASTGRPPLPAQTVRPKLLFFYTPTSGASRRAEGFLAQVLQRRGNHNTFLLSRIDASKRPDLTERLRIDTVPTLLVVTERRVQARLARPRGCTEITAFLSPWLR